MSSGRAHTRERWTTWKVTRRIFSCTASEALARPWNVLRTYYRNRAPDWTEVICAEDDHQVRIGDERYFLGGDGALMPTRSLPFGVSSARAWAEHSIMIGHLM